jgi:hypothetical protein
MPMGLTVQIVPLENTLNNSTTVLVFFTVALELTILLLGYCNGGAAGSAKFRLCTLSDGTVHFSV